jgi:hypothetical protein
LSSFDHGTFEEVATVAYALIGVILDHGHPQAYATVAYAYNNVANRIV